MGQECHTLRSISDPVYLPVLNKRYVRMHYGVILTLAMVMVLLKSAACRLRFVISRAVAV